HYSIQSSKEHDYLTFYNKEILLRKEFDYPPYSNIISIVIYGEKREKVLTISNEVYNSLIKEMTRRGLDNILDNLVGPNPAPLERIKNNYRFQILIKFQDKYMKKLKDIVEWVCILNKDKI